MADERIAAMADVLTPLWRLAPNLQVNIYQHAAYGSLKAFCQATFRSADRGLGFSFGLADALRSLGLPCLTGGRSPSTIDDAARALVAAFDATTVRRIHLCPLNNADRLADMRFGPATVRRYDPKDLEALFDAPALERRFPGQPVDPRLAEFQWLIVDETAPAAPSAGQRALPHLYEDWSRDLGAVDPHAGGHPGPVLAALFGLMLAPWEDWHSHDYDWRAFSIPWVHVASDDPFAPLRPVPTADTLNWMDVTYTDGSGEPFEAVRPLEIDLHEEADVELRRLDDHWWRRIEAARATSLFETPVEHFLVRGALSDGMDQIMAHMTTIEAAIGLRTDFGGMKRSKADRIKPAQRMARRVGRLLGDPQAEATYADLFELRSGFVHGRAMPGSIPSADRNAARRLARRVACALIDAANGPAGRGQRADWLNTLA